MERVSFQDLPEWARFQASLSSHPVVRDSDGTLRYEANRLVRWWVDHGGVSLEEVAVAYWGGAFGLKEYMAFYRGLGYTLCGFGDIFFADLERLRKLAEAEHRPETGC